jgi:hypothetical protein
MRGVLAALIVVVPAVASACGGQSRPPGDEPPPSVCGRPWAELEPIPIETLAQELARTFCQVLYDCPTPGSQDLQLNLLAYGGPDGCARILGSALEASPRFRDALALVREGRVHYEPRCSRSVLDWLSSSCSIGMQEAFGADEIVPRRILTGTVQTGGSCRRDFECDGDSYCLENSDCEGVCTPRKGDGESCDGAWECRASQQDLAFCSGTCSSSSPPGDAGVGQSCAPIATCAGESDCNPACAPGAFCNDGTCAFPIAEDAPCASGDPCASGSVCLETRCVRTLFVEESEACVPELDTTPDSNSGIVQYCNPYSAVHCVQGRCELLGDGSEGSACRDSTFAPAEATGVCANGLTCEPAGATCIPSLETGEACEFNFECASGTCREGVCSAVYCPVR